MQCTKLLKNIFAVEHVSNKHLPECDFKAFSVYFLKVQLFVSIILVQGTKRC